jgi:hypothetical protein
MTLDPMGDDIQSRARARFSKKNQKKIFFGNSDLILCDSCMNPVCFHMGDDIKSYNFLKKTKKKYFLAT